MKLGRFTPAGETSAGGGGGAATGVGRVRALRSPDTERRRRVITAPATPETRPAATKPKVARDSRLPPSTPSGASGASGASSRIRPEVSRRSTAIAQPTPTTVGTRSAGPAPGRASTAAQPARPAATKATLPTGIRERSQRAAPAAKAAITATTITDRNSLSEVPKVWIAHSLTGPGVRLITAVPTEVRTSAAGEKKEASNCATPKPTAAAATPAPIRKPVEFPDMGKTYLR